ncbi:MAG: hypothetical protein HFK00_08335 [Oscillospiraceae bacterium]|nr:hypothetical protein [Oscillospiraceae bacterium]
MLKKDYFKGWYFKCSSKNKTIAFIPAFHSRNNNETASLQIITNENSYNLSFPFLEYSEKPLYIRIGNNVFSENGIIINIKSDKLTVKGNLQFGKFSPIGYDIMGPFKYIPFMQCRHSVYSMRHQVSGYLTVNNQHINFQSGIGYMEGDCGTSFPNRYIWTQCFFGNGSLMLSAADIPMLGLNFTGIIGVIYLNGKEYRIATYLGAKICEINSSSITVVQGSYKLNAKLIKNNAHSLAAPDNGKMNRIIHESASCKAYYKFSYKNKILCEFISDRASFEFEYK